MSELVLIIEDDEEIGEIIEEYLIREMYEVRVATDGQQGLMMYEQLQPALVLVDLMLPTIDGFDICRKIRSESDIPIIVVSARQSDVDKIQSLGLGADDYMTKPFSPLELMARVKSQLRRYRRYQGKHEGEGFLLSFEGLEIHKKNRTVQQKGMPVPLTLKEYELLLTLAEAPGQVFSKEQLYQLVWKQDDLEDIRTVTVHIKNLRHKLGDRSRYPRFIDTVWGIGYKFIGQKYEST
ncbi:response regulator transcription factor [bacterium LRH843]|nr:response regulator transcription factor [bacterium LRH843]